MLEIDWGVHVILVGVVCMYMVHGPPQRHEADQVCLHCMTGCVVCTEVGSVDWRVSGTTVQHLHLLGEHTLTRTPHTQ